MDNSLPSQARSPRKWIMLAAAAAIVLTGLLFFLANTAGSNPTFEGVPIPFGYRSNGLAGSVTYYKKQGGINVYQVKFLSGEVSENVENDKIYLINIPASASFAQAPFDKVITTLTNMRGVDYFGYRYSDATASAERAAVNNPVFANRFPHQFFASQKARDNDAAHGNQLAVFEQTNSVTFLKTDDSAGSVISDPAGSLYVIVVNEPGGARIAPRIGVCRNGILEASEDCDDGNDIDDDQCTNQCTIYDGDIPIPFGNSVKLNVDVQNAGLPTNADANPGDEIRLMRIQLAATGDDISPETIKFKTQAGQLSDAANYRLKFDINADGSVEQELTSPQVSLGILTFEGFGFAVGSGNIARLELYADVSASPAGETLQMMLATPETGYVAAEASNEPLEGISTNGTCTNTSGCQMIVTTVPSTIWQLTVPAASADAAVSITGPVSASGGDMISFTVNVTNNGPDATSVHTLNEIASELTFNSTGTDPRCTLATEFVPPRLGCNFGTVNVGQTSTDAIVNFDVSASAACDSVIAQTVEVFVSDNDPDPANNTDQANTTITCDPVTASPYALEVTMNTLPETNTATAGQTDLALLRFVAKANTGVFIQTLFFKTEAGIIGNAERYGLYRINEQGNAVKVMDSTYSSSSVVGFSGNPVTGDLRTLPTGTTATYEVRADNLAAPAAGSTLQLKFHTSSDNFIYAKYLSDNTAVGSVRINGTCFGTCYVDLTTVPSTVWTLGQ